MKKLNQNKIDEFVYRLKMDKFKNVIEKIILEYNEEDGGYIYLRLIKIKKSQRNKQYGSRILSGIIKLAKEHGVCIKIWITDVFGADINRLSNFYKRLGFIEEENGNMIYTPAH
jgi:GNAT superfamily N-acetyltransferase